MAKDKVPDEPGKEPAVTTRERLLDFLAINGLFEQMTGGEREQFIRIAQAYGLDPFKRELHVSFYGEGEARRFSCIVGYEVYIKRAERTGKLNGWQVTTEGDGQDMKAILEVYRKDWSHPFRHEVYMREAAQKKRDGSLTGFWSRMPRFQLKKVAISQGFRLAFPDELGGLPYEGAELPLEEPGTPPEATVPASEVPPVQHGQDIPEAPASPEPSRAPEAGSPDELEAYLAANEQAFSPSHLEWIRNQVKATPTPDKRLVMLNYARTVVKNKQVRGIDTKRNGTRRRLPNLQGV